MRRFILVTALLVHVHAFGQNTDIESLSGLQFNFGNPGARSLGMGGAFLGLADDASAAAANPAGLTALRKREFSLELRYAVQQQVLTTHGTFPDVGRSGFKSFSRTVEVNFASVVVPVTKQFVMGAYYHEPLRTSVSGEVLPQFSRFTGRIERDVPNFYFPRNGEGVVSRSECLAIIRSTNDPFACQEYTPTPFITSVDVRQRTFGITGAWQIATLSLGASLRFESFREEAFTLFVDPDFEALTFNVQSTGNPSGETLTPRDARDLTFTLGFKWAATPRLSVGGVYKQGPEFAAPTYVSNENTDFQLLKIGDPTFHVPDIYGLGVSVRPIPLLTVNLDAVRVNYSNLVDQFVPLSRTDPRGFGADNVTEFHVGAEYYFATKLPIAVRAGWWHDPAHSIEWRGGLTSPDAVVAAIYFPRSESQGHWSVGVGLALRHVAIDAAYESSRYLKRGSVSFVTRF